MHGWRLRSAKSARQRSVVEAAGSKEAAAVFEKKTKEEFSVRSKESIMDVIATKIFQLDVNGDTLPFDLVPAKNDEVPWGGNLDSQDDEEFYTSFLPNLRPGVVIASINGRPVQYELFEDILDIIEDSERPLEYCSRRGKANGTWFVKTLSSSVPS